MRICFLNRSYWPDTGATGQLLTELAEDLVAQHGFDVRIITGYPLRASAPVPAQEVRNGVRIVRASGTVRDPQRFVGRAINYVTYFVSACVAALRVTDCDVVVAMTDPPIIGLAALVAAWRSGARFVYLCEDVFPEVAVLVEDFHSPLVNRALEAINRFLLRRADRVIALGDTMKRRLVDGKGADPSKIVVIHNWADCEALRPGTKPNAFSRAHGLDGRFVVMHAGNIGLSQNLEMVLEAADALRDRDDIRFVFVGDGARRASLDSQARARGLTNVLFLPYQPREAMADSYATADVFLVSLKPGLAGFIVPSKLYSILAAGRPCIVAVERDSEAVQITERYGCGLVVPPGDGIALASRILDLHRDRALAAQLGDRARHAGLTFDRKRQVAVYADLFRSVAGAAGVAAA